MKRTIEVGADLLLGDEEVVLEVERSRFAQWALEMTLLVEGLSESITVVAANARVLLRLHTEDSARRHAKVELASARRAEFELPRNQAEYLQNFVLRAYRDEMAAVEHVHIEGDLGDSQFDLTLVFRTYRPPMTPEEAERLLDE